MYDFYLDGLLLPVPPEQLKMSIANQNSTYILIDQGEINLLKRAGLTEIEFECLLPQVKYPAAVYAGGFQPATYYLAHLELLKVSRKPFQFIVSRAMPSATGGSPASPGGAALGRVLFATNIKVSLEDYTITESAKNGFDLMVKIRLKQYRDYGTQTVQLSQNESGDTLMGISGSQAADSAPEPSEQRRAMWRQ